MQTELAPTLPAVEASGIQARPWPSDAAVGGGLRVLALEAPDLDLIRLARGSGAFPQVLWFDAERGIHWLGLGCSDSLQAADTNAALELPDRCRARLERIQGSTEARAALRYWGGIAFDPDGGPHPELAEAPAARFHLPAWLVAEESDGRRAAWVVLPADEAPPSRQAEAQAALEAMARSGRERAAGSRLAYRYLQAEARSRWRAMLVEALGELDETRKVVLSRDLRLGAPEDLDPLAWFEHLDADGPGVRFAFRFSKEAAFLGAPPERLLGLSGDAIRVDCLAGTAPRHEDPLQDAQLAAKLAASPKEQREHAFVVDAVRAALEPCCAGLTIPAFPRLMRLPTVQHLHTEVLGSLRESVSLATLLGRLFPTPAVCGTPREAARALIRRLEGRSRGWYAGTIGSVGLEEADFAVAIRSVIVRARQATILTGAGIVAGSDPDAEFEETERKARSMLRGLEVKA